MELSHLIARDPVRTGTFFVRLLALPDGFAGFQAPARLREADALRVCGHNVAAIEAALASALTSAHHIQDYHFCARVTARCNALTRWHRLALSDGDLAAAVRRLSESTADVEFVADHAIGEPYQRRPDSREMLSVTPARDAATLEALAEVFQRSSVEFKRLNPKYGLTQRLPPGTPIHVPDPGLAPLLAVHLAARVLAAPGLSAEQFALVRALVPVAAVNPTTLDTVLSYLVIAAATWNWFRM
jgi:hypothetical protein